MFTRSEFEAYVAGPMLTTWHRATTYSGLHYATYPQHAFQTPDAEEYIRIARAPKQYKDNGIWFWLAAECTSNPPRTIQDTLKYARRLATSEFRPYSEADFNSLVESQCTSLLDPPPLPLGRTKLLGALAMQTMQTELCVSLVAEYENEFLHFFWETTA